jgi:hypothetical protein
MTAVGQAIRDGRRRKRLTIVKAAVLANLAPFTVSLAERAGIVTERTAERLSRVLDIPVERLRTANDSAAREEEPTR